ncbi:metallophosphoesterase family protein [Nitrospirillum pindoramense]|uniref:Serine/threonine protein phosphatase 1 n=1 Tax=Nitrospirillum amazonense TaxID=28077 RepID=A0A560HG50_9PROT|nr:hypothetical protein [Nitrospirillum amazonense]TWB45412.1 hypothetical protein FBZ90_102370 [Nitrospirillum amazonense]
MNEQERFVVLGRPRRIWAVGAIHGDVDRLAALHDDIGARFQPGDRLVYLGNLIGRGPRVRDTVDELLSFRRAVLSVRGVIVSDLVYLRGGQEEMWQKLLQLQFAPNPIEVLQWMMSQGVDATLAAYGGSAYQGVAAARDGAVSLARWTGQLRTAQRAAPGHDTLFAALRRAAYTERRQDGLPELLFVNAGIDISRPLAAQGDSFWWGGGAWHRIEGAYAGFRRVVRGYDPSHGGPAATPHAVTLDGGCGFNGALVCGCFGPDGELLEVVEV